MKGAETMINVGSIVKIKDNAYCDFPSEKWGIHFAETIKRVLVKTFPTNNGNFKAVDSNGKLYYLNYQDIVEVER